MARAAGRISGGPVQGGRAAGPAAQPPRRASPACFGVAETACGRSVRLAANPCRGREGFCRRGVGAGPGSSGGPVQGAGRRPGGAAAEAGSPACFGAAETACGRSLRLAANPGEGQGGLLQAWGGGRAGIFGRAGAGGGP